MEENLYIETSNNNFNNNNKISNSFDSILIESTNEEANISGEILLLLMLLSFSFILIYIFKKLNLNFLNQSVVSTILGLIAGFFLHITNNKRYIKNINEGYIEFFLILLLPPIVFESAYNLKREFFYKNIGSILMFAVFGTLISLFFIASMVSLFSYFNLFDNFSNFNLSSCLAFGSLISSTDPVGVLSTFKDYPIESNFYQIIYGESILNDAVSIVFYEASLGLKSIDNSNMKNKNSGIEFIALKLLITFGKFSLVIVTSIALGIITGYITAIIIKLLHNYKIKYIIDKKNYEIVSVNNELEFNNNKNIKTKITNNNLNVEDKESIKNILEIEVVLLMLIPWVSYLFASMLNISGIVVIMFNGLIQGTYTKPNLTKSANLTIEYSYKIISYLFEALIFIFLGIGFFSFADYYKDVSPYTILILIPTCIVGRCIGMIVVSKMVNLSTINNRINKKKQFFLIFAGVRGAMAFALALKSLSDFKAIGKSVLIVSLVFIAFTMIYSSLLTSYTIKKLNLLDKKSKHYNSNKIFELDNEDSLYINVNNKDSYERITFRGSTESKEKLVKFELFDRLKLFIYNIHIRYLFEFVKRDNTYINKIISEEGINLESDKNQDNSLNIYSSNNIFNKKYINEIAEKQFECPNICNIKENNDYNCINNYLNSENLNKLKKVNVDNINIVV